MAEEGKSNLIAKLWFPIFIVGALAYGAYAYFSKPPSEANVAFKDPEESYKHYLKTVYAWGHNSDGGGWTELEKVIPEGDWQWFNDNWESMFDDPADVSSGIDPNQAKALGRRVAMSGLLDPGPNRGDCAVLCKDVGATEATMLVLKDIDEDYGAIVTVKVVKYGSKWKVANFAGGRNAVENTDSGRRISYTRTGGQRVITNDKGEEMMIVKPPDGQPAPAGTEPQLAPYGAGAVADANKGAAPPAPEPAPVVAAAPPPDALSAPAASTPPPAPMIAAPAAPPAAAPPVGVDQQTLLAPANLLMEQAAKDWAEAKYARSMATAKNALAIYERHLGANHPKVEEVKKMIEAARQMQE